MTFGTQGSPKRAVFVMAVSPPSSEPVSRVVVIVFAVGLTRPFWQAMVAVSAAAPSVVVRAQVASAACA